MVRAIPLCCAAVFTHLVADVLDAAEDRKHLTARATVLGSELAGDALAVAEAPVDDQPSQLRSVDRPVLRRPDRPSPAEKGALSSSLRRPSN